MLAQSKEIDRLRDELAKTNEKLENQEIKLANAGSIAEASLSLTKVFEESQKAADLYLKNVK
ncbi:DNA repair protein [Streptococcus infantarius]|nr:DNA repair protein [Streptococcus infantarius]MCY7237644.1 DNA repair protein [Streptococcus infantarius]MCY7242579.1 DNA repair protein [Streptococcus infantarius]MDV2595570.1 DNA repair protein [Streptococcus infantarius]